jgi:hypothetical protein
MEKTFKLKYTEEEYWAIYESKFTSKSNIFIHFSTFPWIIITFLFLLVTALFGFVFSQNNNFNDLVVCVITLLVSLIFLAHTLKKCQELILTLRQIRVYYDYIKNGVEITINKANLIFAYQSKLEIIKWVECKNIIIEEKYIQFYFYARTPILLPKGLETQHILKQFENEIESFI